MKAKNLILIASLGLFAACSSNDEPGAQTPETIEVDKVLQLTAAESAAQAELQDFNIEFFQAVNASQGKGNVLTSPMSAQILLSFLANASHDELTDEIVSAFGCSSLADVNSLSKKYMTMLPGIDPASKFSLCNGAWYSDMYTLSPSFQSTASDVFSADIFKTDFTDNAKAVKEINGWVSDKTNKLIPEVLRSLQPTTLFVLANAMYFKGSWKYKFDKQYTKEGVFHGTDGDSRVEMMFAPSLDNPMLYSYSKEYGYQVVKRGFGNGAFEAVFVLPVGENTDIDEFISSDALKSLKDLSFQSKHMFLTFPKFKMAPEEELELNKPLAALGIKSMCFDDLKLFNEPAEGLLQTLQKATVEFNEDGAEASAVTIPGLLGSLPPDNFEMIFDHPFVFMINLKSTGTSLIAGKVANL